MLAPIVSKIQWNRRSFLYVGTSDNAEHAESYLGMFHISYFDERATGEGLRYVGGIAVF